MKREELRIGNFIRPIGSNLPVKIDKNTLNTPKDMEWDESYDAVEDYYPIELTLEILLKSGFVDDGYGCDSAQKRFYYNKNLDFYVYVYFDSIYSSHANYRIEYVHQLQNLIFAVTYQDLEINF